MFSKNRNSVDCSVGVGGGNDHEYFRGQNFKEYFISHRFGILSFEQQKDESTMIS